MKEHIRKDNKNKLFLLFILLLPFSWIETAFGSVYRILIIVLFIIYMSYTSFKIITPLKKKSYFRSWISYIGYSVVFTFIAGFNTLQVQISIGMILLTLVSIIFLGTQIDANSSKLIDTIWIIAGAVCVVLFMTGSRINVGITTRQTLIIMGTKTDPNEFASFFVVSVSITLAKLIEEKRKLVKIIYILLIMSSLWVILSSGSRGALLSVAVAMIVTLFVNNKMGVRGAFFSLLLAVLLYFIIFHYLVLFIPESTLSRISIEAIKTDAGSGRSEIWRGAMSSFIDESVLKILFGYGYGGISADNGYNSLTSTMHNQFLQVLVSYGLVGFTIYLSVLLKAYVYFKNDMKEYLGSYWGILVMGLTITMGPSYKLLWIVLMLPMLSIEKGKIEVNSEKKIAI